MTIFGDMGRFDEEERIREVLLVRVGRLDAVVVSLGRRCIAIIDGGLEMWEHA